MFTFLSHTPKENSGGSHYPSEEMQESIHPYLHEVNITEGSEFLDDAIAIEDQPLDITAANKNE
ncbi:hypothetical protein FC093_18995 [Ilyomonas limi]|uniref:Uncharacterized protein n=1 Tax=Ilyomonas limi TaxID=2575867 RepID=A0A4U3KTX8_9BACT|nr:hypothetical protein [Ilyomonas limi]TKK65841.1 hypothetical protein FC093_18995 [Ilyomonas limi]